MSEELDIDELLKYMPHRAPFLLIDRVLEVIPGKSLVAIKNVTYNEPFFAGHFPGLPIMPGVLIVEAMAQACGILIFKTKGGGPETNPLYFLAGLDNIRFKRMVRPGDQLRIEAEIRQNVRDVWKLHAKATVDDELVCTATILNAKAPE